MNSFVVATRMDVFVKKENGKKAIQFVSLIWEKV